MQVDPISFFEGLDVLVATGLDETGGVTTRRCAEWVAEQQKCEAVVLKQKEPVPQYCFIHRKDGDSDFVNTFLKEMSESVGKMIIDPMFSKCIPPGDVDRDNHRGRQGQRGPAGGDGPGRGRADRGPAVSGEAAGHQAHASV